MSMNLTLQPARRLRAIFILVCLLGTVSGTLLAQDVQPNDPGVQGIVEAELVTPVDQSLEIDGVQFTVLTAYADTQRIVVRVKLSGDYEALLQDHMLNFVLRDDTSRSFSYSAALPVQREDDEVAEVYDVIFYNQTAFQLTDGTFEIIDGYLDTLGESIDVQLTIGFTPMSALGMVLDAVDAANASPVGPFDFIFTMPIFQPRVVNPGETLTIGDVAVTLERVSVTPSETEVEVCYTLPDAQDWQPSITLTMGGVSLPATGTNLIGLPALEDTERCVQQRFNAFADTSNALTVTVDRLQTSVPDTVEAWEGMVAELATHDVEAVAFPSPGAYFNIESTPEGMTDAELAEIINTARENMRLSVEGPWVFEVDISQD